MTSQTSNLTRLLAFLQFLKLCTILRATQVVGKHCLYCHDHYINLSHCHQGYKEKNDKKVLKINILVQAENTFKNTFINLAHGCLCSDLVDGYAMEMFFCFGTNCGAIVFAVATDTTISCSLGRKYSLVLKLFFFDIYD